MSIQMVTITGPVLTPSGEAVLSGTVECRLSAPAHVIDSDGHEVLVAMMTRFRLAGGALPADCKLAPVDLMTPSGLHYDVTFNVRTAAGPETWSIKWAPVASATPVYIGAVPRLDEVPGIAVTTEAAVSASVLAAATASKDAAAASALAAAGSESAAAGSAAAALAAIATFDPQVVLSAIAHPAGYVPAPDEFWVLLATQDAAAPTVTAFSVPATYGSLVIPISTFTATDDIEVTGYLITESATPPAANDPGWVAQAPTATTAGGVGARTFYAWAKDAAENVSASVTASCTITIVDETAPVVTAFVIPATSATLAVPITTFTATDAVGVTGYKVQESATPPLAGDAGWSGSAPTQYVFATEGAKTLWAFAKDAAGNVSAAASDTTTITIPANVILNPGLETQGAGDSTTADGWTLSVTTASALIRIGTDGGVTPHGGSWMAKHTQATTGTTNLNRQDITGDQYRASAGTFTAWLRTLTNVAPTDSTRAIFATVIAYDAGSVELARVVPIIAGNATVTGGNTSQRITLNTGAWVQVSLDIRTALDAALGANLANVHHVYIGLRSTGTGAFTFYADDLSF